MDNDSPVLWAERLAGVAVGLFTGSFFGLFLGYAVYMILCIIRCNASTAILFLWGILAGLALLMALWGFISPRKMFESIRE